MDVWRDWSSRTSSRIGRSPLSRSRLSLILGDGSVIPASAMKMMGVPKVVELDAHPDASRLAERTSWKVCRG